MSGWKPPSIGSIKVNLDAFFNISSKRMGLVIIRNAKGHIIHGSTKIYSTSTLEVAKAMALKIGLQQAQALLERPLIMESNT